MTHEYRFPKIIISLVSALALSIFVLVAVPCLNCSKAYAWSWSSSDAIRTWHDDSTGVTYKYKNMGYTWPADAELVSIVGISGASEVEIPAFIDYDCIVLGVSIDGNTEVKSVYIDHTYRLEWFDWTNGSLSSLKITDSGVDSIDCSNNQLTSLDFTNLPSLYALNCSNNQLTSLDFANMPALRTLVCDNNRLSIGISSAHISEIDNELYCGQAIKPTVSVGLGALTLREGIDYTVSYSNNINAGTAEIIVTGTGSYYGAVTKSFTIEPIDISTNCKIYPPSDCLYAGSPIKPSITVESNFSTLKEGIDYTVSYKDNVRVGYATFTVSGIGNYFGTIDGGFSIKALKSTSILKLTKGKKSFTVKWKKPSKANLRNITGYQIQYSTSKKFTKKTTKTKTVKASSKAGKKCTLKVTKLKKGKKYYVKVRTYKTVSGKKYYSSWSKAKAVKTKK